MDLALELGYSSRTVTRVLLIGCDPAVHLCVLRSANSRGIGVEVCDAIAEGRAAHEAAPFSSVLVDAERLGRPLANGGLNAEIRAFPNLIVACALYRLRDFAGAGVFATLTKPFTVSDVDLVFDKLAQIAGARLTPHAGDGADDRRDGALAAAFARAVDRQLAAWGDAQPAEVYEFFVRALEQPLISRMLDLTRGNQVATAAHLGLNRNTLRKKLKYLGLLKARTP